jgi:hypothetical protein
VSLRLGAADLNDDGEIDRTEFAVRVSASGFRVGSRERENFTTKTFVAKKSWFKM